MTPYSYRSDVSVPTFDDTAPLIIFDGLCVLCSSGVQFMMARDPGGTCRFAAIQNPIAAALYKHYGLDAKRFDTFMVLKDGKSHLKWQGVLAAGKTLGGIWRALATLGHLLPNFIGDRIYDLVQRNRLTWFGSRNTCFAPSENQLHRFMR
jgi:predicted DCC family thiol-disulfide oxidoreductase YuxK